MSDDGFGQAELRDGETRDDTAHATATKEVLDHHRGEDICPDCDTPLEGDNCPTCPECGWSDCYGGPADA